MCDWLGGTDAASAMEQLMIYDVELTTVDHYSRWLQQEWAINTNSRLNQSEPFVSLESLDHETIFHIQRIYAEDIKLFVAINHALDRSDACSVGGEGLRAAG